MPPPPRRQVEQTAARIARHPETEVGAHVSQLTDHAVGQPRHQRAQQRVAAVHVGFHQEDPLRARRLDHARRRRGVERDRFFAQHRLAGGDAGQRLRLVKRVRRRDVDGIDRRVGQQLGHAGRRRRQRPPVGEGPRLRRRAAGDVDDAAAGWSRPPPRRSRRRCRRCRRCPTEALVLHPSFFIVSSSSSPSPWPPAAGSRLLDGESVDHRVVIGLAGAQDDLVLPGRDVDRVRELLRSRDRARRTAVAPRLCPCSIRRGSSPSRTASRAGRRSSSSRAPTWDP